MSWGGLIFVADGVRSVLELPDDYSMPSLGDPREVFDRISELFPEQEHRLGFSSIADTNCWIELSYNEENDIVDSVAVRTNGNSWALGAILDVAENLGAKLFDNQAGEFVKSIDSSSMSEYRLWIKSLEENA